MEAHLNLLGSLKQHAMTRSTLPTSPKVYTPESLSCILLVFVVVLLLPLCSLSNLLLIWMILGFLVFLLCLSSFFVEVFFSLFSFYFFCVSVFAVSFCFSVTMSILSLSFDLVWFSCLGSWYCFHSFIIFHSTS